MVRMWVSGLVAAAMASAAWAQCSSDTKAAAVAGQGQTKACCQSGTQAKTASMTGDKANCSGEAKAACMSGDKAACASAKTAGGGCCMSKLSANATKSMELIPAIQYVVGDQKTTCDKQAAELAKGDTSKIHYAIGGEDYADMGKAYEAYAKTLDATLADFTTVKYAVGDDCTGCPETAKSMAAKAGKPVSYRLAAYHFKSEEAAKKAAVAASEAASKVKMSMKVGDKDFCCSTMAGDEAKKSGKQVEYVVGDKTTCCNIEAAVNVARAKLEAAIQALDAAYAAGDSVASAG